MMTPLQKLLLIDHISKDANLLNRDVRVAIQIVQHFNSKKGKAWPSIRYLADLLSMSKNTVQAAVNSLEKTGWIIRNSGCLGKSNMYQFVQSRVPKPEQTRPKLSDTSSHFAGTNKDYYNPPLRVGDNKTYITNADKSRAQAKPDPVSLTAMGEFYDS